MNLVYSLNNLSRFIIGLRYLIPCTLNSIVLISFLFTYFSNRNFDKYSNYRRVWIYLITQTLLFTYIVDLFLAFAQFFLYKSFYKHFLVYEHWLAVLVHCIGTCISYAFGTLTIAYALNNNKSISFFIKLFYNVSFLLEATLLTIWIAYIKQFSIGNHFSRFTIGHILVLALRVLFLAFANFLLFSKFTYTPIYNNDDNENAPLNKQQPHYGSLSDNNSASETSNPKNENQSAGIKAFFSRMYQLLDVLWPRKSLYLQSIAALCFSLLLLGRYINLLVPIQLGMVIQDLSNYSSPWKHLSIYVILRFFQGSGGLLQVLQSTLWIPIMQWTDQKMSVHCFTHLLNLSLAFHTHRKTGEILRILDKGAALNNFFQMILFNILPTVADIFVALGYFLYKFGSGLSLIILVVITLYGVISVVITRWRTEQRRDCVQKDNITRAIYTDALLNYDTIKYFTAEEHEIGRYIRAFKDFQTVEKKVIASLYLLNMCQNMIIVSGIAAGTAVVCSHIIKDKSEPAELIVFITFLSQLYAPLNNLGMIYRSINTSLVDSERLMHLLAEPTDINDKPNAIKFSTRDPYIKFDNVRFSYDNSGDALSDLNFDIPTGKTVALVGESGSGKSTILRLLYRFYDVTGGKITINGIDIRDMQQKSLREHIAIIPQDCALFNESIAFNLKYGKENATDEDVINAAKAAQMHERILEFAQGYDTRVGERGVRLSGGEKQRIAIARALLRNSAIICLDEATSALDTNTEREIQAAFNELAKGRTSIIIAHRLSTIAKADKILFISDKKVVESGTHTELLQLNGQFAKMWAKQIEGESKEIDELSQDNKQIPVSFENNVPQVNQQPSKKVKSNSNTTNNKKKSNKRKTKGKIW